MSDLHAAGGRFTTGDEGLHAGALHEEWTFGYWAVDGSLGGFSGYRLVGSGGAWYWWALARPGAPLLHVTEWDIPRRANPLVAKAQAMWAELICESPFEQWTVGNETYAVALDDPADALQRAYGEAQPIASDVEWYAAGSVTPIESGYEQPGLVHGVLELAEGPLELDDLPAHRTHRWSTEPLPPLPLAEAFAHLGLRAPFRFPDGSVLDLVLASDGWRRRS